MASPWLEGNGSCAPPSSGKKGWSDGGQCPGAAGRVTEGAEKAHHPCGEPEQGASSLLPQQSPRPMQSSSLHLVGQEGRPVAELSVLLTLLNLQARVEGIWQRTSPLGLSRRSWIKNGPELPGCRWLLQHTVDLHRSPARHPPWPSVPRWMGPSLQSPSSPPSAAPLHWTLAEPVPFSPPVKHFPFRECRLTTQPVCVHSTVCPVHLLCTQYHMGIRNTGETEP